MAKRRKQISRVVWQASHSMWPAAADALRDVAARASLALRRIEEPSLRAPVSRVIFACMHNAGRSQMATAFFNQLADPARARAISAGTRAWRDVDPKVVEAMREVGLEVGQALSRQLNRHVAMAAGRLVTMGCEEDCPFFPGVRIEDWAIDDPRGQSPARVRAIRDEIRRRVAEMVERNGWGRSTPST